MRPFEPTKKKLLDDNLIVSDNRQPKKETDPPNVLLKSDPKRASEREQTATCNEGRRTFARFEFYIATIDFLNLSREENEHEIVYRSLLNVPFVLSMSQTSREEKNKCMIK